MAWLMWSTTAIRVEEGTSVFRPRAALRKTRSMSVKRSNGIPAMTSATDWALSAGM